MIETLIRHHNIISIVGNIITVHVSHSKGMQDIATRFGDLARVEDSNGTQSLAQVIKIKGNEVSLQIFSGTQGISTDASVRFLGHSMQVTYSNNILGRIFNGVGEPLDGGSSLQPDPKVSIESVSVNPMKRVLASNMIRTDVLMYR
ncbi:MAG: hypothetical protein ACKE51_02755 [Methylococcaceae bacterium]